jgi:RNA polymerase sigma factor (sigma-70 family)
MLVFITKREQRKLFPHKKRRNRMNNCNGKRTKAQVGTELDVERGMKEHEGLIHAFIQRQGGGKIRYEDALHAGRIGLWRALLKYDPGRGTRFSTYAWVAICRQIHQAAKEEAEEQQVPITEMDEVLLWREDVDPEQEIEREEVRQALQELVNRLPDRLCQVVRSRYELGGREKETLEAIGAKLGVCKERVRQMEEEALAWLRHPARSWPLRQLIGKNRAADYRRALAENAALRRRRGGRG